MIICFESKLPKTGWIHRCFTCSYHTSHYISFKDTLREHEHELYICKHCFETYKNESLQNKISLNLSKKVMEYISDKTIEPYKARTIPLEPPSIPPPPPAPPPPPSHQYFSPPPPPIIEQIKKTPSTPEKRLYDLV